jgi:hypothetical protein
MRGEKYIVVRTAAELAKALGLSAADGRDIERHCKLGSKIIETVKRKRLSPDQLAARARISRARAVAIMTRNTTNIESDELQRVFDAVRRDAQRV